MHMAGNKMLQKFDEEIWPTYLSRELFCTCPYAEIVRASKERRERKKESKQLF